jgi:hypothetical protein
MFLNPFLIIYLKKGSKEECLIYKQIFSDYIFTYKIKKIEILFLLYMSSIITINKSFLKMSTQMQTATNTTYKNLELYIPRASLRITEPQIKETFFRSQIGIVEYCDIVIVKDKETKQPLYASVFLKLDTWNPISNACADFEKNGSIKIFINSTEFWIILPNKNPLPRTHVNNSQLAASTEKLFEQSEALEKKANKFEDEMRAEMAEMRLFMKLQQQSIDELKTELASANADIEQLREDNSQLIYQLSGYHMAIYGDSTVDEYEAAQAAEEEKKLAEDKEMQDQFDAEVDELLDLDLDMHIQPPKLSRTVSVAVDFSDPSHPLAIPVLPPRRSKICDEDACIFSLNNIPRSLSPVPIISSRTVSPPSLTTLVDIVLQNPEKAMTSRDFCGNS